MSEIKGIYAASVSILNSDLSLNIEKTLKHCEKIIDEGCHGVVVFGSTGQAQLISLSEKIQMINNLSKSKYKDKFILGTGLNSLADNINFMKIAESLNFEKFLIMPPAYYNYSDTEVLNFYSKIIKFVPESKIILYNFEKLCGYKFSIECVTKLAKKFPKNIIGVKDSSYNLYQDLKLQNFAVLPGSELKLLSGLQIGCSGIITATCNVTAKLSRKVYDDFLNAKTQSVNKELCEIRKIFDKFNLISSIHSFLAETDKDFINLLPTLSLLNGNDKRKLFKDLEKLNFHNKDYKAA
tara:strand:- start:4435 stop:5319 length:885 start_codon:yes stop_codon:yes gene_type:complete